MNINCQSKTSEHKAILLDCDGVIVHSEPLNFACWCEAYELILGKHSDSSWKSLVGLTLDQIHRHFCGNDRVELDDALRAHLLQKKNETFHRRAVTELGIAPGLENLVRQARECGLKIGVVSAAISERLKFTLKTVGMWDEFDLVLSEESMIQDPQPLKDWRRAALELGVTLESCVVFEDSVPGIESARNAGAGCIVGMCSGLPSSTLRSAGASCVVNSFEEFQLICSRWSSARCSGLTEAHEKH